MQTAKASKIFAAKGKSMPKKLFAKWQWDQSEPWLDAEEDAVRLAVIGETVYVGEYRLVKVHRVDLKVSMSG